MGSQRVWLVRAGILLIGLPLLLWALVELTLGFLNKARQYTTIAQDSRTVTDGYRFAIESAEWKDGLLKITFCREDLERRKTFGVPLAGQELICYFWDAAGVQMPKWVDIEEERVAQFFLGSANKERRHMTIRVPDDADAFAIEYGQGNGWRTKIVRLPPRPIELSLKTLKGLRPR